MAPKGSADGTERPATPWTVLWLQDAVSVAVKAQIAQQTTVKTSANNARRRPRASPQQRQHVPRASGLVLHLLHSEWHTTFGHPGSHWWWVGLLSLLRRSVCLPHQRKPWHVHVAVARLHIQSLLRRTSSQASARLLRWSLGCRGGSTHPRSSGHPMSHCMLARNSVFGTYRTAVLYLYASLLPLPPLHAGNNLSQLVLIIIGAFPHEKASYRQLSAARLCTLLWASICRSRKPKRRRRVNRLMPCCPGAMLILRHHLSGWSGFICMCDCGVGGGVPPLTTHTLSTSLSTSGSRCTLMAAEIW